MAPSNTIVGLLAASLLALGAPWALAADADNPDWPCVQRKVATLTAAQMWDGPAVDDLTQWLDNEEIGKLIAVLASRRVPLEQAAAEERYNWDVRVFAERQQSLPLACEVPVLIEQRLFELGRAIRSHMND